MGAFRKRTSALGLAAGLLLGAAAVHGAEDARALLIRSLQQGDEVPLSGEQVTRVVRQGGRAVVQRVRRRPNRLRIDYLSPAGVRGQVMVDDGRTYRFYRPRSRTVEVGPSRLARARAQRERQVVQLRRGRIAVEEERTETVAGRPARVLLVRAPGRSSRRLWIDRERAVVLKVEETQRSGQTVSTAFTQVDLTPALSERDFVLAVPPGTQVIPAGLGRPVPVARARTVAQAWGGLWEPRALPPGFALRGAFLTQIQRQPVLALLYSDGQRTFTLFQGATAAQRPARRMGNLNVLHRAADGVALTIVGALPEADLRRALDSAAR